MSVLRRADVLNQIPQVWSSRLFSQAENLTFWRNFEGPEGSSMPILRKEDLMKGAGDTVRFDIVLALTGAGQTADTVLLEGNEEALKFRQTSVVTGLLKHATRWSWYEDLLQIHNSRKAAQNQLAKWLSGKLDDNIFKELTGVANGGSTVVPNGGLWAAGTATSRDTVADTLAGGKLTLDSITELKAYAQSDVKIEPLRIDQDANEYFGLVCHPYTIMNLKRDDTKWAQAQRDAQLRGGDNPVFTGAAGIWDGVIIYSSNRVPRSANANTPAIQVADNVFFGAQAMSRAYGSYPDWTEELFSYGEEVGVATKVVVGQKLNVFDLTSAGGAAASAYTAIGSIVDYASAVAPGQP